MKKEIAKLVVLSTTILIASSEVCAQELIKDPNFNNGIKLLGTIDGNGIGIGKICKSGYSCNPSWRLAEWYSEMSLIGNNGGNSWGNPYKAVTVFNKGFRLAVNGTSERYTEEHGCPNSQADWASLLMEQIIKVPLSNMSSLNLSLTAELEYFDKKTNNDCYASQMTFYLLIKNKTGGGFWFGIPIFDNRYSSFPESISEVPDAQTGLYIYKKATLNPIQVNNNGQITNSQLTLNDDILPTLVNMAESKGYQKNNLSIESFNIGWENPSNNIATMKITNLSLNTDSGGGSTPGGGGSTPSVNYEFNSNKNAEGWSYKNMLEQYSGPYGGSWYFACNQSDPQLLSPNLNLNASGIKKVQITMANNNPSSYSWMQVFWKTDAEPYFSESKSKYVKIASHGGWSTYDINMQHSEWRGTIKQIRIDPVTRGNGSWIGIDNIRFKP